MKKGDWLFTCSMKPLQFDKWTDEYDFETIEGSHHSRTFCGLKPISENYAKWFLKNEFWNFFEYLNEGMFKYSYSKRAFILKTNDIIKKGHRRYFKYQDFEYLLPYKDKHISIWDIYESYVRFNANKDNIPFEGI